MRFAKRSSGYDASLARPAPPCPERSPVSAPDLPDRPDADPVIGHHPPERQRQIDTLRWINLAALLGLIVLGVAWEVWLAPLPGGSGGALALKVLPLTLAIAGVLRHRLYTCRWLSLLVWLYFTEGVVRAAGDTGLSQQLAFIEVALSVVLFAGCAAYVRLRLRVLPPKAKGRDKRAPGEA